MILTPDERKKLVLRKRGLQARAARELRVTPGYVSGAVSGRIKSSLELKRFIAKGLRRPMREVWPELVA